VLAAIALAVMLGALSAGDAGASSKLAWLGAGAAGLLVALGSAVRSPTPVHCAVGLLGALLLARQGSRLLLAPLYGAGLLLVEELAYRSTELAGLAMIAPGVLRARAAAVLALTGAGASAAAGAALAVTAAPERSVLVTAVGTISVASAFGAITRYARRRFRTTGARAAEPGTADEPGPDDQGTDHA
jgi:hypothetical protein